MRTGLSFFYSSISCCLLTALGCGSDGPATYAVSGTITFDGQPLAGVQVGFVPVEGQEGVKPARGRTDAAGEYTLNTYLKAGQDPAGATAGRYKVTVVEGFAQKKVIEYEDLRNNPSRLPPSYADAPDHPARGRRLT